MILLSTIASIGVTAASATAFAADTAPAPAAPVHHMHGPGPGPMTHGMASPFMHAIHQLNLTSEQQQRIHSLLDTQHQQMHASMTSQHATMQTLANPGDPNYAAAVAAAKTAAANEVQRQSDLDVQIYGLLTPEQQAQLPKILADMKARMDQHRANKPAN